MQFGAVEDTPGDDHELIEDDDTDEDEDSLSSQAACSSGEESEGGTRLLPSCRASVTLLTLLKERLLAPGEGSMSIHYLGQTFIGDLLPNGKIKSQETDLIFSSPSAWAIHCKKIINPDKKSGCGWASVKYKGRKLDAYKNAYFKKKRLDLSKENAPSEDEEMDKDKPSVSIIACGPPKVVVKHNVLGCRHPSVDMSTMVESVPFSSLGKIQPFLVTMSTNACLVIDFHSHLTNSEVVGYLGGHWDVNAHSLNITHAFPCRCRLGDRELAPLVEADVWRSMEQRRLTVMGWYHSHPRAPPSPSLRDLDAQLDYQIRMKGPSDASYIPCVGAICSPYYKDTGDIQTVASGEGTKAGGLESSLVCYWVMPPPENRPQEYGRPMLMSYTMTQDQFLSQDALNEMKKCAEFFKGEPDVVKFGATYNEKGNYLDKLRASLTPKFPRDQSESSVWSLIHDLLPLSEPIPEPKPELEVIPIKNDDVDSEPEAKQPKLEEPEPKENGHKHEENEEKESTKINGTKGEETPEPIENPDLPAEPPAEVKEASEDESPPPEEQQKDPEEEKDPPDTPDKDQEAT